MKKIFLAITGSIAAIKSFDLIKSLQAENFEVQCIVTKAGKKLCSVKALEAMTGFPVLGPKIFEYEKLKNQFEKNTEKIYAHLELSKNSVAMIVAPCTANTLAKISSGQADDFLTTAILAYQNPILIAPAMNTKMWENSTVQENIEKILCCRGTDLSRPEYLIIPPQQSGILACGEEGVGKMAEVTDIVLYLNRVLGGVKKFSQKKILINLGGTQEKIDPVRYIGNFSSGKTGKIFAEKFFEMGFGNTKEKKISVVHGISTVKFSEEIFDIQQVQSAQEMYDAMEKNFSQSDIVVFCAAVADFKVEKFSEQKIKKNNIVGATQWVAPTLKLSPNIDIAKTFAEKKLPHQVFIGFCLETLETNCNLSLQKSMKKKSKEKKFDIVFGNSPENFGTTKGKFLVYFAKENFFQEFEGEKGDIFEEVLGELK